MYKLLMFRDDKLLRRALTHRSYVNENPEEGEHNERLEFLGDAILNFLSGEYLYRSHPDRGEDELTRRRSALVDEKQLAKFAIEVGLDFKMRLGKGAIRDGGYQNPNLLSSTFEAVIGAYYLDNNSNIEAVRAIIEPLFESVPEQIVVVRSNVDSKNRFQEWVQRNIGSYIMSLIDGILLTLVNAIVCLALPRLLSVILASKKPQNNLPKQSPIELEDSHSNISSYVDVTP